MLERKFSTKEKKTHLTECEPLNEKQDEGWTEQEKAENQQGKGKGGCLKSTAVHLLPAPG